MATILVVDDRPSNRQFLATLLGYSGHRVLEAGDGAEALRLVRSARPALVITDILMPTMDGYEFVQRLRADESIAATSVMFHTATYSEPQANELARACGVRRVLPKPCEPETILDAVADALGGAGPGPPATMPARPEPGASVLAPLDNAFGTYLGELQAVKQKFDELVRRNAALRPARERTRALSKSFSENVARLQYITSKLSALVEVGMSMTAERDPERLVRLFFSAACEIIGSRYAAVGLLDEQERGLRHVLARGVDAELFARAPACARGGLFDKLMSQRRTIRGHGAEAAGLPKGHPPVRSILGVTVATPDRIYGWLFFADTAEGEAFREEDERLAGIMAMELALRYEHVLLYEVIQRHATAMQLEATERKRAQEALREREAALHRAQVMARLAHVVTGPAGEVLSWSETLPAILGVSPEAMPTSARQWLEYLHPDDRERVRALAVEAARSGGHAEIEYRFRRGGGSWGHLRQVIEPQGGIVPAADTKRWFSTIQDVTEHKQQQTRIERLTRVYAVLSGINALIVRAADRDELLREACRVAVEEGGLSVAWAGMLDTTAKEVRPVAWCGIDEAYALAVPRAIEADAPGGGVVGIAIRSAAPVISNDIENDPRLVRREEALRLGSRSLVVLPLKVAAKPVGVLVLQTREVGFFDEEEMKLLEELAGDLSFALDHIDKSRRLEYLSFYDSLTGLANRALFSDRLEQHLHANAGGKIALLLADVERMRTINQSLGRHSGDALLQEVAARLSAAVDAADVARVGPDQFAVLLRGIKGRSETLRRAENLWRGCLEAPVRLGDVEVRVAVRTGLALFPSDGRDAESLLRTAEAALRKAKETGERFLFHSPEMNAHAVAQLALETSLRRALRNEEYVLHYQPKLDIESGRITGAEALIRWQSPEQGLVPPGQFIPLLEETGLILEVGAWALRRAVIDHRHWLRKGLSPPRIAVNVSAIQLRQRDFVDVVRQAIALGANPTGIDIEITESLLMDDVEGNIRKLKALRELGMRIAIDDFGTGFSSLGYLARLPVHALKIDRSFVITMLNDPDTMTLVSTIISLAHALRLSVIAEGVDSEEQAKMLRLLRCDEVQGYLVGRPVPMEELTPLLRRQG